MNLLTQQTQQTLENEFMVLEWGGGERRRGGLGVWDGRVHPATLKMHNQQGPVIAKDHQHYRGSLDGRSWGKINTCICVWLSHFVVHLKLSQQC